MNDYTIKMIQQNKINLQYEDTCINHHINLYKKIICVFYFLKFENFFIAILCCLRTHFSKSFVHHPCFFVLYTYTFLYYRNSLCYIKKKFKNQVYIILKEAHWGYFEFTIIAFNKTILRKNGV